MKVLHIGNSLTLHGRADAIGWPYCHGMAASSPENDFVHQLQQLLRDAGKAPELTVGNSAAIEREPENYDIPANLGKEKEWKPDVVVIQLSENNPSEKFNEFIEKYGMLIDYFSDSKVYCVGPFWPSDEKQKGIAGAAASHGAHFVSLTDLHSDEYRAIGLFEHPGVAGHPGDRGMKAIAEHIFAAMKEDGIV